MAFPSPGADWPKIDAYLRSLGIRINTPTLGETEGGGHVAASEHFQHRARDYPTSNCDAPAIAKALEPFAHGPNYVIDELFYSGTRTWYDSGTYYVPRTTDIEYKNHFSHVHVGIKRGGVLPTKPGPAPQPAPQKGFLMALTDAQQGDVYNILSELKNKAAYGTSAHPNYGDLVNDTAAAVVKLLKPDLDAIRAYLTAGP